VPLSTFTPREVQSAPVQPTAAPRTTPHPTPRRETGAWPVQAIALAALFALVALWLTNA
jgi:hypothetical protein